jgi:hypothetical protein
LCSAPISDSHFLILARGALRNLKLRLGPGFGKPRHLW